MRFVIFSTFMVLVGLVSPAWSVPINLPELANSPRAMEKVVPSQEASNIAAWRKAATKQSEEFFLDLGNWILTQKPVESFAGLRIQRQGSQIVMMPNADQPANSFGFVESPLISVARSDEEGAVVGLRVTYTSPSAFAGLAPTLRVRAATENFRIYAEAGVTPTELSQSGGRKTAIVTMDRSRLKDNERLRFIVDLVSLYQSGTVDPNFTIRLESAEVFVISPDGNPENRDLISAAYMEVDGDIYAHENGEDEDDRHRVRSNSDGYAYDGSIIAVIDNGRLYAYDADNGFERTTIEDDANDVVIAVAVAGNYVAYVEEGGRARVYDMVSRERDTIFDRGADGVSAAGDRRTVLILDVFDNGTQASVFGYDAEDDDPEPYDIADNGDVLLIRGRQSGVVN